MSDPIEEFDDPALKSAIRKALGAERAPAALGQRVTAALAAQARTPAWRNTRVRMYALAAMLVIGLGVGAMLLLQSEAPVPDWFADAMITTHDAYKTVADHKVVTALPEEDLAAVRKRLQDALGHPALVAMLGDGWKYTGGGICEINRVPAAHLMFSNGEDTISIFSISGNLLYTDPSQEGKAYSQTRNDHELAGFVYGGAIHCLVAQSPTRKTGLKQIVVMRDRLRSSPTVFDHERPPLNIAR